MLYKFETPKKTFICEDNSYLVEYLILPFEITKFRFWLWLKNPIVQVYRYKNERWVMLYQRNYRELLKRNKDMKDNITIHNKHKFNLKELRHIAVNFAISCENGYKMDFDNWFKDISGDWRNIANR
jgi:hypothetical protein